MTLLDLPRGAASLVVALGKLRAQGYEGAHYDTLATLLGQHVGHVKASARAALDAGVVTIDVGGGRGKPSVIRLAEAGARLVSVPTASGTGP